MIDIMDFLSFLFGQMIDSDWQLLMERAENTNPSIITSCFFSLSLYYYDTWQPHERLNLLTDLIVTPCVQVVLIEDFANLVNYSKKLPKKASQEEAMKHYYSSLQEFVVLLKRYRL